MRQRRALFISGSSSDGRTPDLGSGGRRFKSCLSDHIDTHSKSKIQSLCYWFKSNYVAFRILINGQIERMIYVSSIQPCSVMVTRRTLTPSLQVRALPGLPLNQQYKLCRRNYTLLISVRQERKEMIKRPNLVLIEIF